jgi:hypothetical protein
VQPLASFRSRPRIEVSDELLDVVKSHQLCSARTTPPYPSGACPRSACLRGGLAKR